MADPIEEEIEEEGTDQDEELEAAFNEDDEESESASEKKPEEKTPEPEKEKESSESEEEPEKKPDEKNEKEEDGKEKEELSAADIADKRGAEIDKAIDDYKSKPPEKEEPEKKEPESDKPILNKEKIMEMLKTVPVDKLPDEIVIGDDTVDLKRWFKEFPDDAKNTVVLANLIAQQQLQGLLDSGHLVTIDQMLDFKNAVSQTIEQIEFNSIVEAKHSGWIEEINTDEFKGWIKDQGRTIKLLFNSPEPEDCILMLNAYKEDMAKEKVKEHDEKARKEKKEKDAIHKDGSRTQKKEPSKTKKGDDEELDEKELEAIFNEDDDEDD